MSDPLTFRGRRGYATDLARDILAVVLLVLMVAGLTWVGFATDWRLGVAVLSITAGGIGVALGMNRT